ncbi:hypothetical protein DFH08DRAFT_1070570 [Mycena albidolilacea]|uniref:Uncharacterized protein n=1 Tax=Mycena albidolilacea TaxID=1033008 RepID=A0AAD7ATC7_9AGAR|nr:hypothetical protein DFH08DRAFT_1070570 [Mycena albidolilacea]
MKIFKLPNRLGRVYNPEAAAESIRGQPLVTFVTLALPRLPPSPNQIFPLFHSIVVYCSGCFLATYFAPKLFSLDSRRLAQCRSGRFSPRISLLAVHRCFFCFKISSTRALKPSTSLTQAQSQEASPYVARVHVGPSISLRSGHARHRPTCISALLSRLPPSPNQISPQLQPFSLIASFPSSGFGGSYVVFVVPLLPEFAHSSASTAFNASPGAELLPVPVLPAARLRHYDASINDSNLGASTIQRPDDVWASSVPPCFNPFKTSPSSRPEWDTTQDLKPSRCASRPQDLNGRLSKTSRLKTPRDRAKTSCIKTLQERVKTSRLNTSLAVGYCSRPLRVKTSLQDLKMRPKISRPKTHGTTEGLHFLPSRVSIRWVVSFPEDG